VGCIVHNVPNDDDLRMQDIARELRRPVPVSSAVDARVMRAVRRMPRHGRFGLWSRLTTPKTVTVTPLSWGLLAASLLLFATFGAARAINVVNRAARPIVRSLFQTASGAKAAQSVQFVLVRPDAKKVAVVGDFNGWDAKHAQYQAQHRGGGVWSVTASVPPGHHRYSFVVDDSVWVADPSAPRVADNDYGLPNSAIVVEEQK
jgi:hypothetical protein